MGEIVDRSVTLPVPCPACSHENLETLARLETDPQITCNGCGKVIQINASELRTGVNQVEKSLLDLKRKIERLRF